MSKVAISTCAVMSIGAFAAGCQTAPVRYAGDGVQATYHMASSTGGQLYTGAGAAIRQPFHDVNLMQDQIEPVLLRAESHPYDLSSVDSCADVLNQVAELDLALGPDVDTPKPKRRSRSARGADFAAHAALDAAGTAAEHFIPMRSTIKQITGATRYENHVKHAVLAGTTRRSFLKAIGMAHNCSWPAAPLDFAPTQVVAVDMLWAPRPPLGATMVATAGPAPSASSMVIRTAAYSASPAPTAQAAVFSRTATASAAARTHPGQPILIVVHERLTIPAAAPAPAERAQRWKPPQQDPRLIDVAEPLSSAASAPAAPPWSASFASAAPSRR